MSDLKPCPFCGSKADYDWGSTNDMGGVSYQNGWVTCTNSDCDASIDVDSVNDSLSDKDLIAKWNNQQPTIADFLAQQKPMLDKTKSKMVSVASLEKFMRGE